MIAVTSFVSSVPMREYKTRRFPVVIQLPPCKIYCFSNTSMDMTILPTFRLCCSGLLQGEDVLKEQYILNGITGIEETVYLTCLSQLSSPHFKLPSYNYVEGCFGNMFVQQVSSYPTYKVISQLFITSQINTLVLMHANVPTNILCTMHTQRNVNLCTHSAHEHTFTHICTVCTYIKQHLMYR